MPSVDGVARDPNRVLVFDTTLRDGEQAPGFSMGVAQKLEMARALAALNVDVIEAGFAAASPGDEEAVRVVSGEVEGPIFCSLSRATESDIMAAHRALGHNRCRRLHIFLGTSPIHRRAKFNMSADEVLAQAVASVQFARTLFEDVEFSAEDAIRTEPEYLGDVLEAVAEAGAQTLNVPDTVGYSTPEEIGGLFQYLNRRVIQRYPHTILSTHCHDDLGMAVANTLSAVKAGARQVEVAINGIGERAGNCALEEVVMALRTRADQFGLFTGVDSTKLVGVSRLLSQVTETPVPRNKAIVGINAFAHEAGIHQHGVLADARTYEIMLPQDVGFDGTSFVLGKHSGRHAVAKRASVLGHELSGNALSAVFAGFKRRADEIGEIDDAELVAIIRSETEETRGIHAAV
ncbi:2-isopropylmalate synthase [Candidatus Viadribacter manganicus]|uniref:2-isopropylmalate synthase n=1 Tax=Candidatus Viadribacter manganicus TaxID=1759059 RepID=A0A1B1AIG5_9PROT|nr:2-isopropylmalate synthase [Candidatus Viadribacter manganicus]ANP46354.1 2-isopropylmalate synthase [Candidatus Viadribacter manganicus]